jgi:phospholipid-binding lipoprotein MlaA
MIRFFALHPYTHLETSSRTFCIVLIFKRISKRMHRARRWLLHSTIWLLPAFVAACASMPRDASLPINDPNEQINRRILEVNQAVLHPIATVVKTVTPKPVHNRLQDLSVNLREPRVFANDILQLRFGAAYTTALRFITNTTLGIGGLFDVATQAGLPQQTGDFGQTLFVWGVADGPYVIRPYYGPATMRDAVGSTVDLFSDPAGLALSLQFGLPASLAGGGLDAAVRLGELKEAEDASIDFYSFLRASYYQMRRADLREAIGLPKEEVESPATSPSR